MVAIRFRVIGSKDVKNAIKPRPTEIARANRLVINKIVTQVRKEVGTTIPRGSGVRLTGFRRVRLHYTNAKVRKPKGVVWIGGNQIAARYAGKPRNVTGGAKAGKHFFKNSFVATMKNDYTSVFYRSQSGKLKERKVDVENLTPLAIKALENASTGAKVLHKAELEKILNKRKR